jgi:uncharacterized protein
MAQSIQSSPQTSPVVDTSRSGHARLRPVAVGAVRLSDDFWAPRRRVNHEVTLPFQYQQLEASGVLDNFRRVTGKVDVPFRGRWFADSDLYKWLEAAAWILAASRDPELEQRVDTAITEIEDTQEPDGYLATYYMVERRSQRWSELPVTHELYCAGHLIQAAVAHHRATSSKRLLNTAIKLADHICEIFGPEEDGKRLGTDGHPEIEMALVELARDTGDTKYLRQARFFVDVRGHGLLGTRQHHEIHGLRGGREYQQDHKPFRDQHEIVGHAVRAVYLNAGATDLYAETGDQDLLKALERLWENMTTRKMYVSGGIGARYDHESFGKDYELPNARAYAETCAAIGSVMWNWRMLLLDGDARYGDLMELALYNAVLPGLSLDGQSYFYQNPLADDGQHRRQPWFGVACCPPNIARLLASLPGYFYSISEKGVWAHLYTDSTADIRLDEEHTIQLRQRTNYPWEEDIRIEVEGEGDFALMLRVPSWCEKGCEITVNGETFEHHASSGSYAEIRRRWQPGDAVHLKLPMPVRRIECNPRVVENREQVALMRGPLLYCLEQIDNTDLDLRDVVLPDEATISVRFRPELLSGVAALSIQAGVIEPDNGWDNRLYRTVHYHVDEPQVWGMEITAIPYYGWANREAGAMQVWLRRR